MENTYFFRAWPGVLLLSCLAALPALAQTPNDGVFMLKNQICFGLTFTQDQWSQYWEGRLKRENGNLGTVSRQTTMLMGAYGLTDRINLLAALPWVRTRASAGTMAGVDGLQDWGLWLKAEALRKGSWSLTGVAGITAPASNYLPDYMPLHVGLGATEGVFRLLSSYQSDNGLYTWAHAAYHLRSHTGIERTYYYTTQGYYSDKVDMPNALTYGAVVGAWLSDRTLRAEASLDGQYTTGGFDIRRQDMGFPSNKMNFIRLGLLAQYFLPPGRKWGGTASCFQVLHGRNVGQSFIWNAGLLYRFRL